MPDTAPILWSFRRCPYAMRARLALSEAQIPVWLREVVLRNKPDAMLSASPKGTVPVLVLPDGTVIDESLDIMAFALDQRDPSSWRAGRAAETAALIAENDGPFKHHLDRYKYPDRYGLETGEIHRAAGLEILRAWNDRLAQTLCFSGDHFGEADAALAPFVRQFANTDRAWFDAQPLPHLRAWLDAFLASPRFAAIMDKYPTWQSGPGTLVFSAESDHNPAPNGANAPSGV